MPPASMKTARAAFSKSQLRQASKTRAQITRTRARICSPSVEHRGPGPHQMDQEMTDSSSNERSHSAPPNEAGMSEMERKLFSQGRLHLDRAMFQWRRLCLKMSLRQSTIEQGIFASEIAVRSVRRHLVDPMECPHAPQDWKAGGNQNSYYIHCTRCGSRLKHAIRNTPEARSFVAEVRSAQGKSQTTRRPRKGADNPRYDAQSDRPYDPPKRRTYYEETEDRLKDRQNAHRSSHHGGPRDPSHRGGSKDPKSRDARPPARATASTRSEENSCGEWEMEDGQNLQGASSSGSRRYTEAPRADSRSR